MNSLRSNLLIFTPSLRQLESSAPSQTWEDREVEQTPQSDTAGTGEAEVWTQPAWPQAGHLPTTLPRTAKQKPKSDRPREDSPTAT